MFTFVSYLSTTFFSCYSFMGRIRGRVSVKGGVRVRARSVVRSGVWVRVRGGVMVRVRF